MNFDSINLTLGFACTIKACVYLRYLNAIKTQLVELVYTIMETWSSFVGAVHYQQYKNNWQLT